MPTPGDVVAGYVVDTLLGRGGTAQVFLAHKDTQQVALKVLNPRHRNPEDINRLHREFELAQQFSHPRIVTVYECGDDWLAMQALDGGSAKDLVGTDQSWIIPIKLTALQQIAGALDYIHDAQVVHCDVKPSNIMRARSGGAVLTDFGIAQELSFADGPRRPVVQTSLPYAAPEVLRGQPVTAATDQYALACTAVELFDGKPPFTARTAMKLVDLHLNATPWPISYRHKHIPRAFDSIVAKAMAKDPLSRYPTCTEFITLLTHAVT
ncbi:serine/threonine protein kinase [Mycobacterium sp. CBMA271]|uniref:serine/threonine-protein kinase n=1 Tax=unclassified Mycobacteroides TaxID=2618759 RepID=UPI0012DF8F22|nr:MULTISPECIES: serine/threonine-protein kinase [unclassified Mycobacteroides]MUM15605.1 serine/threonine protein kinase [Mycobacteroides sp. CBMA 326]MUM17400.1 serine/threonine protein kinase [Mycobacteroides sp. CBMA 326]MUM21875.1 serine/threonine protein kinase [Mycobacteroides sp. CBMA 271]